MAERRPVVKFEPILIPKSGGNIKVDTPSKINERFFHRVKPQDDFVVSFIFFKRHRTLRISPGYKKTVI